MNQLAHTFTTYSKEDDVLLNILEATHDSVIVANKEGNIIFWNSASTKIFGYTKKEAIGRPLTIIMPKEMHEPHNTGMKSFVRTGKKKIIGQTLSLDAKKKNGSTVPIELSLSDFTYNDEFAFFGIIRDISERKNQNALLEATDDSIIGANKMGLISYWNRGSEKLFGYSKKEAIGQPLTIIMPKEMHDLHEKGMRHHFRTGEKKIIGKTLELYGKRKDGALVPVELSLATVENNEEIAVFAIIRDITDRKNNEKDIIDLSRIINTSPSCVKVLNATGNLVRINKVGVDLMESPDFESLHMACIYDVVHPEDRAAFVKFNNHICNGGTGSMIYRISTLKGKQKYMESFARTHVLPDGSPGNLSITNDITDRVFSERQLKQKNEELQEAKRLAVVGEFTAGIAHEINNPLAIISAKADLLSLQLEMLNVTANSPVTLDNIKDSVEIIKSTVKHSADLIKNLKTLSSKVELDQLEFYNLKEVIDMALNLSSKRCDNEGIEIHIDIESKIKVECNKAGLAQVFLNLITNSIDAIKEMDSKWISVEAKISKNRLKVYFTDSGLGIDKEIVEKITNPFFTTKKQGEGTGLGLSISVKYIDKMKGKFYYNPNSKNTQFIIEFNSFIA
jgi:PAS domain S-box-containing protein